MLYLNKDKIYLKRKEKMTEKAIKEFRTICRANHWKCTPQRITIYMFMNGNRTHPGVDDVWAGVRQQIPGITRETVFRILCDFADRGLIARMDNLCSARFDSSPAPHGHFFCMKCGKIEDFPLTENLGFPKSLRKNTVTHIEMRLTGLCEKCRSESAE